MNDDMLSRRMQKILNSLRAYMQFQTKRGAKHGSHPYQEHHLRAKDLMRMLKKIDGNYKTMIDGFQRDEIFRESQLAHGWTEEWCKYLDYLYTVDISHQASPEQRVRYKELYHLKYNPANEGKGPMKDRPDYRKAARAIMDMNMQAGQIPRIEPHSEKWRDDLDPKKLDWLNWLSQNWKTYFADDQRTESWSSTSWSRAWSNH